MGYLNQLSKLAEGVVPALDAAKKKRAGLARELAALERAGILNATPFWNKGKYLYLSYPMRHYERERVYVGANQARIAEALAKIARFKKHGEISRECAAIDDGFHRAHRALKAFYCAVDKIK